MNEDEATRMFSRAAESLPNATLPPATQLIQQGKRVQRRKRLLSAGSVAAGAALIIGAGALWLPGSNGSAHPPTAPNDSSLPDAPDGTRWVGLGGVVVAVPDWWTTGETQCAAPVETTVYFDTGAEVDCSNPPDPATVREVSALAVFDAESGYGESLVDSMTPIGDLDGRAVVERKGCEKWFVGVCRRLFAVPSEGVVFAVTIADSGDGDYEDIRDSLRVLPETMTTIPLATDGGWTPTWGAEPEVASALVAALEGAGLRVNVEESTPPSAGRTVGLSVTHVPGTLLDVSPALGSPIAKGGAVTVTVAGEPDDDDELSGEPPTESDLIGQWELIPGQTQPDDGMSQLDQISFEPSADDWVGWYGSDGCNQIGGRLTLQPEGLTARVTSATEIACEENLPVSGVSIVLDSSQALLDDKRLTLYDDANEPLGTFVRTGDGSTGQQQTPSEAVIAAEGIRAHLGALVDYHQSDITKIWVNESLCETEQNLAEDCRLWTTEEREELRERLASLGAVSFVPTRAGLEPPAGVAYAWAAQVDQTAETAFSVHVFAHDGNHAYWGDQPDNARPCGWQIWTLELNDDNLTATLKTPVRTC